MSVQIVHYPGLSLRLAAELDEPLTSQSSKILSFDDLDSGLPFALALITLFPLISKEHQFDRKVGFASLYLINIQSQVLSLMNGANGPFAGKCIKSRKLTKQDVIHELLMAKPQISYSVLFSIGH
eukprot:GHVH01004714.1.p1 GENE.GHVH01004714.1~~GHVH01004714.1.p1  ORF type:complete len:125 (+),score=12.14 GHVH01004714.1:81-455(+)